MAQMSGSTPMLIVRLAVLLVAGGCASKGVRTPTVPSMEDRLRGRSSWLPIGPEVYRENDVVAVEKQMLAVRLEPRWFLGFGREVSEEVFDHRRAGRAQVEATRIDGKYYLPSPPPYPDRFQDLPTADHGVRLSLDAEAGAADAVTLHLSLSSSGEPLFREVEHRWSNALPFLFAFYVDGHTVVIPSVGFGKFGGANWWMPLTGNGEVRDWCVRVDASSLRTLLPDGGAHELCIVAAFSNRQHGGYLPGQDWEQLFDAFTPLEDAKCVSRQILVRSGVARLRWDGKAWCANVGK